MDTLYHELIHYAMYVLGRPYRDGQVEFEKELIKQGVSSTRTVHIGKYLLYCCPACQRQYETELLKVFKNPEKYYTPCCKNKIKVTGEKIYTGEDEKIKLIS